MGSEKRMQPLSTEGAGVSTDIAGSEATGLSAADTGFQGWKDSKTVDSNHHSRA